MFARERERETPDDNQGILHGVRPTTIIMTSPRSPSHPVPRAYQHDRNATHKPKWNYLQLGCRVCSVQSTQRENAVKTGRCYPKSLRLTDSLTSFISRAQRQA